MNNIEPTPQPTPLTPQEGFDVEAADRERLDWRLGGQQPTERALGRDESLKRDVEAKIGDAQAERNDTQQRLAERLGDVASKDAEPEG